MSKNFFLCFTFLFSYCCMIFSCFAFDLPSNDFSRQKAIDTFFKEKPSNLIEGIWSTADDKFELAIVKNTFSICKGYDYIGFITQSTDTAWKPGEIKLQIKATAISKQFIGSWHTFKGNLFGKEKILMGSSFKLSDDNTIQYIPEGTSITSMKMTNSLYRIYPSDNTQEKKGSATGFFITSNIIVTNYHVIKEAKTIEITYKNDQKTTATVIAKDPVNDLALLEVKNLESPIIPLNIANTPAQDGETVYVVGFPLSTAMGVKAKLSQGIINSVTGVNDDIRTYQISVPIQPGNSGSPLMNNKGQVIGVVSSSLNGLKMLFLTGSLPQNVNYAIKINYINNLLTMTPAKIDTSSQSTTDAFTPEQIMSLAKEAVVFIEIH